MNIFKKFLALVLVFVCLTIKADDVEFDELDNWDFDNEVAHITRSSFNKANVYNYLIDFRANDLLAEDFYRHTYFLNKRPVYTFPIFLNYHNEQLYKNRSFNIFAFYNESAKMRFTPDSYFINSYLKLSDTEGFIQVLKTKLNQQIVSMLPIDIPQTVGLFTNAKLQQRRAGLVLQFLKSWGNYTFEISTPLIYQERNYFFDDQERKNIKDQLGEADKVEQEKLTRAHFVADKLGLSDTRIKISHQFSEREKFCGRIGAQIILPTAFAFKSGLYGSKFRHDVMNRPNVDLCRLITLAIDSTQKDIDAVAKMGMDLGYNIIDWLSAVLLDDPLGNNKHFGIGGFLENSYKISESIKLDAVVSLDYLIPRSENRFYQKLKNPACFSDSRFPANLDEEDPDDIALANILVNFLNQQTVETFFPLPYKAMVKPGFMFQFTMGPNITVKNWNFNFGYDFWIKQKDIVKPIFKQDAQLVTSPAFKCMQNKFYANLKFNKISRCKDWAVYLSGEQTFANSGIGNELTAALGFQINF